MTMSHGTMQRTIHDISVPIRSGGLIYPGNPAIEIELQQAVARGAGANVSAIRFGSHTGTHVDAPRHFFDDAAAVDELPLELLMGPARVLVIPDDVRVVAPEHLPADRLHGVERLVLRTRNSTFLTQDPVFHEDYTYVSPEAADHLVHSGVRLVGVDYLSVEQFHSGHHRTHLTLLGAGVVIVEGLNLAGVAAGDYELRCLPLLIAGADGAPARAVLVGP